MEKNSEKKERLAELDSVLAQIRKQFGDGAIMRMGDVDVTKKLGVNLDDLLVSQPVSGEEAWIVAVIRWRTAGPGADGRNKPSREQSQNHCHNHREGHGKGPA